MEVLSDSAKKRLPAAIQKLAEKEQLTFVFLRMRKDESYISRQTGKSFKEVQEMIGAVQHALSTSGALDLIRDPVFYPIDHPKSGDDEDGPIYEISGEERDPTERMALDKFYQALEKSVNELPKDERRLLSLWFDKEMSAKSILNFYNNLDIDISSKKLINETKEQDIFYAVEKNIKNLLSIVRTYLGEEGENITPANLKAILNETGIGSEG